MFGHDSNAPEHAGQLVPVPLIALGHHPELATDGQPRTASKRTGDPTPYLIPLAAARQNGASLTGRHGVNPCHE